MPWAHGVLTIAALWWIDMRHVLSMAHERRRQELDAVERRHFLEVSNKNRQIRALTFKATRAEDRHLYDGVGHDFVPAANGEVRHVMAECGRCGDELRAFQQRNKAFPTKRRN